MDRIRKNTLGSAPALRRRWRVIVDYIGDIVGAVSIFAAGYLLLLIGHGLLGLR